MMLWRDWWPTWSCCIFFFFFFQAEDGIRDVAVTGVQTCALPIFTSRTPQQAGPHQVLKVNRGHWTIENSCHYIIDWNYDEDRSRIRTGHGPENITRLRRFAIGVLKSKGCGGVAQKMRSEERRVGKEGRFRGAPDH